MVRSLPSASLTFTLLRQTQGRSPHVEHGSFGQLQGERLRLKNAQHVIAVFQHVVGDVRLAILAVAFDPALVDPVLTPDAAALHHAPARRFQGRVNVLGSGFGFVHAGWFSSGTAAS